MIGAQVALGVGQIVEVILYVQGLVDAAGVCDKERVDGPVVTAAVVVDGAVGKAVSCVVQADLTFVLVIISEALGAVAEAVS
jgi:hypothetical protein